VAHTGSRELFRLSVLAIALGVAYGASALFGVSFALGAFLAGMILSESQLSQRAANESLPLRDAFAVLFFVSVGMLFNPTIIVKQPISLVATLIIITLVKAAIGYVVMRLFRYPQPAALMIAATRAQIGEFSFIIAGLGVSLAILPADGRDLILAGAILSILVNPLAFAAVDWLLARQPEPKPKTDSAAAEPPAQEEPAATPTREELPVTKLSGHVVLVGYGRVGSFIGAALQEAKTPFLVIEAEGDVTARLRAEGVEVIAGNGADPDVVRAANYGAARCLMVAIPDGFEGGQAVEQARAINPRLRILARSHSEEETQHLIRHGANAVVMGEHEIAKAMLADLGGAASILTDPGPAAEQPATVTTVGAIAEPPPAS
jgi:CPA2 family monovalent cation:H+ antiporter-2